MNQPVKESRKEQRDRRPGPRGGVTPRRAVDNSKCGQDEGKVEVEKR